MDRILKFTITEEYAGKTVEQFLKSFGYSRHIISSLKRMEDGMMIDGMRVNTPYRLSAGEILFTHIPEEEASENIVPVSMHLPVLYEDEDILIVNKPANMPVHPSQGNYDNTLANGVAAYFADQKTPFVFRAINRLDRDTTGLLILAKNPLSGAILAQMVKKREIHRRYLAIATGLVPKEGIIEAPIARVDGSTIAREVNFTTGEYAKTFYKRLDYKNGYSLVSLTLETGRTHQIRVHMNYIGHPLPGDFLYNPEYSAIQRQALHSASLDFVHPVTKETMHFEAPLPEDMRRMFY